MLQPHGRAGRGASVPEPAPAAPSQGQDEVEVSPPQSCPLGLQEPELGRTAAPARPVQRRGGGTDQSDVYPPGGGQGGPCPALAPSRGGPGRSGERLAGTGRLGPVWSPAPRPSPRGFSTSLRTLPWARGQAHEARPMSPWLAPLSLAGWSHRAGPAALSSFCFMLCFFFFL